MLQEKVDIINEIEKTKCSQTAVAKKWEVSTSCLSGLLKKKSQIREEFENGKKGKNR